MAPSLLHPPSYLSPAEALQLSQEAPAVLKSLPSTISSSTLSSVLGPAESPEIWITYENLLMSSLRTGDIEAAQECFRRIAGRFGEDNDRVLALEGLMHEAEASGEKDLQMILRSYDDVLSEDNSNVAIHKRRIALLRSMGRTSDAVAGLLVLLDFSPTDAEAWSELSDIYQSQGLYGQAVYALEEVIVLVPNAWNIHARLGELEYIAGTASVNSNDATSQKYIAESLKRFCRSIELCDDYLRGYYGLKLVTSFVLKNGSKWSKQNSNDSESFSLPDTATVQKLGELATEKLSEIVRRSTAKEPHWTGYDEAEVAAAKELLASETAKVTR